MAVAIALVVAVFLGFGTSVLAEEPTPPAGPAATAGAAAGSAAGDPALDVIDEAEEAPDPLLARALDPWTGDLDGMIERRLVRILVPYSKTFYFVDKGVQRGLTVDLFRSFETHLNNSLGKKAPHVDVVFLPTPRDQLLPGLVAGRGDIAAANLTITGERQKTIAFSDPLLTGVREVVVSGPGAPPLGTLDALAGQEVVVRESSSYFESLTALNERFAAEGKPAMTLTLANENLEDEDLLEMVNAGLIPFIVMDLHKAAFWKQIFADVVVHEDVAVREGGEIAWAFRQGSPRLESAVNSFVKTAKKGTTLGNMLFTQYLKNTKYIKNNVSENEMKKFREVVQFIKQYAGEYDFDWLLIGAQAYQESRLDHSAKSAAGAVGVMQIKPSTAAGAPIHIKDVRVLESNVNAGVKYLRYVVDTYFDDPEIDRLNRQLFAFAAYNAGPNRIARLRASAAKQGLDPNVWFGNVEREVARKVGQEPVRYVANILKYYVAYERALAQVEEKQRARESVAD